MIPFSPPDIFPEIIDEVVDTLKSGWITTGPKTKRFEKEITTYTGAQSTVCVNSATAGLELMLRWFGVGPGDEVIVPAYTYCASANVILHCGATPIMADVGTDFNIDASKIEALITSKTKVIIPVDFSGLPCDYDALNALVNKSGVKDKFQAEGDVQQQLGRILILSDSAHSFGAQYKSKVAGSLADVSVFSFHAVKNLTTSEGGAVCLNLVNFDNNDVYRYLCVKSLHGQNKDALAKTKKGSWKYDVIEAGYKWNMTDIQASMGLIGLKYYDERTLKRRNEIFEKYTQELSSYEWAQLPDYRTNDKTSSCHIFPLRIKGISELERDAIIEEIFNKDVSVNVHFPPLPMLSVYKNLGYKIEDYPVTYDNFSREISLPVYYNLSNDNLEQVIHAVISSVEDVIKK